MHLLQGTFQPCRHAGFSTPEPPAGDPVPPRPLSGQAKAEWARMVTRLREQDTLSKVDDAALYQYVQLFAETEEIQADNARVRKLSATLKKAVQQLEGDQLVEAIDKIVKLQFLIAKHTQQLRQGHMALRQYLVEFGMTTTARYRVKMPATKATVSKADAFRQAKSGA